ncbi:MAG: thermonuclease family protein, partial [Pseudomonadota bacterium]|nr:thermonuclease family protein [Pseudomonadota bacterium]
MAAELQFGDWRASAAACYLTGWRELARPVTVEQVYDGDTVRLADGRKVRLLGINTPELERDGRRAQPYAKAARRSALNYLASGDEWYFLVGRERRDRYGRWLGYLLNSEGETLGSMLIAEGSAFWVAQGEDISHVSCFQKQESIARAERRGVWGSSYWQPLKAGELDKGTLGFRLVAGKVTKVEKAKSATYVELDDHLVLRISGPVNAPVGG